MSFRARLALFFVLIVIVPMAALAVLVSRLVDDSQAGKASARAGAHADAAAVAYRRAARDGARLAGIVGGDGALAAALRGADEAAAARRVGELARVHGLARVRIARGGAAGRPLVDVGARDAIAAGSARVRDGGAAAALVVEASTVTAGDFAEGIGGDGVGAVVQRDGRTLGTGGGGDQAREDTSTASFTAADFGASRDTITVFADRAGTGATVASDRTVAIAALGGFLALALAGALLVSRQLQQQVGRLLTAARRIGGGDLSARVPVEGRDELAQLGEEFNLMSRQLERRIEELRRERARLRDSIRRVGDTFAANLDRAALLRIGTETAVEAVEASGGRAMVPDLDAPHGLREGARVGELDALGAAIERAELQAQASNAAAAATVDGVEAIAVPIPRSAATAPAGAPVAADPGAEAAPPVERAGDAEPQGLLAVARPGQPFADEERALLASLAAQTGVSLENVALHEQVTRQAVTDELTGLSNHRRFQEVLGAEVAAAQRFDRPVGLLMTDIDNFKRVNDTYGHQQGDLVLAEVARVLRETSREIDEPARYGGEEMAVALPQTDLDGAVAIAERVREAVEGLRVPRLDGEGVLRVTISCGVAAGVPAQKDALVAAADAALYEAKRSGKNRTVAAGGPPAADAWPVRGSAAVVTPRAGEPARRAGGS